MLQPPFFFGGGGGGQNWSDYGGIKFSAVVSYLARLSFKHKDKSTFLHYGPGIPSDWLQQVTFSNRGGT